MGARGSEKRGNHEIAFRKYFESLLICLAKLRVLRGRVTVRAVEELGHQIYFHSFNSLTSFLSARSSYSASLIPFNNSIARSAALKLTFTQKIRLHSLIAKETLSTIMATTPPSGVPPPLQADLPDSSPPQKPTVLDAVKTINPVQDLQRLPSMPCARTSLLFGIVAGASIGGLRFVFSRGGRGTLNGGNNRWGEMGAAANWAVGAWGIASLGAW